MTRAVIVRGEAGGNGGNNRAVRFLHRGGGLEHPVVHPPRMFHDVQVGPVVIVAVGGSGGQSPSTPAADFTATAGYCFAVAGIIHFAIPACRAQQQ